MPRLKRRGLDLGTLTNVAALQGSGGAPPVFNPGGVHFDGSTTWLERSALTYSSDPTQDISWSMWLNVLAASFTAQSTLWVVDPLGVYSNNAFCQTSDEFETEGLNSTGATTPNLKVQLNTAQSTGVWLHYLGSGNTQTGIHKAYINGVDVTAGGLTAAFFMAYNSVPFWVGNDNTTPYAGDMAEVWIAPGQTLISGGVIPPATIAAFYGGGTPPNLGTSGQTPTGTSPAIYLHKNVSDAPSVFANNLGTGGAFSIVGTLTNSATIP